jgi:hypothetical protein
MPRPLPRTATDGGGDDLDRGGSRDGDPGNRGRAYAVLLDECYALLSQRATIETEATVTDRTALDRVDPLKHDHAADDIGLKIELARVTGFDYVDDVLVRRGNSEDSVGTSMAAVEGRFEIIEMYDDLYADFPDVVRQEALAETYLVQGQLILRDALWSFAAVRSFALAAYHAPGFSLPYVGSLVSSLFGRPGYDFLRTLYSRFVLGSERQGKRM